LWSTIFDNAEEAQPVRGYLPPGNTGHIIVTSRNPIWTGVAKPLSVTTLPLDKAIEFLLLLPLSIPPYQFAVVRMIRVRSHHVEPQYCSPVLPGPERKCCLAVLKLEERQRWHLRK